jgi:hypothetical protein
MEVAVHLLKNVGRSVTHRRGGATAAAAAAAAAAAEMSGNRCLATAVGRESDKRDKRGAAHVGRRMIRVSRRGKYGGLLWSRGIVPQVEEEKEEEEEEDEEEEDEEEEEEEEEEQR